MKRLALAVALLIAGVAAALAQSTVSVVGPVTPGNIPQFNSPTIVKDSGVAGGAGLFANPTGAVGLTAVNGSATTAMRSDAAPPLSASVQSALTGTNTGLLIGTGAFGFAATAAPTTAGTIVYWNGSNWVMLAGNNSGTQVLSENASGVPSWSPAGAATVTSVAPGSGIVSSTTAGCSQTAITVSGTLSKAECVNAQTGTSYAIADGDRAKLITGSNAAAQAYSIAQAGAASNFQAGWYVDIINISASTNITITPTTSLINGASTYVLRPGQSVRIISDGTNYLTPLASYSSDSAVKAWCNWTGATTGTNACVAGYNVTNVTRNSAGNYTVNFTTSFTSATSYVCTTDTNNANFLHDLGTLTASTAVVQTDNASFVAADPTTVYIACFGR